MRVLYSCLWVWLGSMLTFNANAAVIIHNLAIDPKEQYVLSVLKLALS